MNNSKNSLLKDFFPIWFSWYRESEIPEPQRAGKPRDAVLPIAGKKYRAAAMMLLFPRGMQNADKIAKEVGSSGGTLRNWMIESRFKELVRDLEDQFATHILKCINEEKFFNKLCTSHDEIGSWSDRILGTLILNIDNKVGVEGSLNLSERLRKAQGLKEPYKPADPLKFEDILNIQVAGPSKPILQEMLRDISNAALESYQTWPKSKRGPRPQEIREQERSTLYRFAMTLNDHLKEMDQALQSKKTKIELHAMIKTAHLILYNMIEELKD
ncbi:MAG: hypothetical protein V3U02_09105 [Calditrichia bacterium]